MGKRKDGTPSPNWGGRRSGSGAKPKPATDNVVPLPRPTRQAMADPAAWAAVIEAMNARARTQKRTTDNCPYRIAAHPAPLEKQLRTKKMLMAQDDALVANNSWAAGQWMGGGLLGAVESEGLLFLGYPILAEMAQRTEFRTVSETIADEMTRKWMRLKDRGEDEKGEQRKRETLAKPNGPASRTSPTGDADKGEKIKELEDFAKDLHLRDRFHEIALYDGLMGRSHLFFDSGNATDDELKTPLGPRTALNSKVGKGWLKRIAHVEAMWVYPLNYNAQNPLAADWYNPQQWYVMGREVHRSRLPTFVGRPLPDLLKPAYSFGGLSLSQLVKPYVDIWIRTRTSVADLVQAFSTLVLQTDLSALLNPTGGGQDIVGRMAAWCAFRDNQGVLLTNKASEDVKNVVTPVSGLGELQQQSLEHMMFPTKTPAVKFTGMSPSGLNASSDGELQSFEQMINGQQEKLFGPKLDYALDILQLTLWGATDPDIVREWVPLRAMTAKEQAELRKMEAETGAILIDSGAIWQEEERERIAFDPESPYSGIEPSDLPDIKEEEAETGLEVGGVGGKGKGNDGGGGEERGGAADAVAALFGKTADVPST